MPTPTNRLATSTSPYLLQHAHNPVDWHPWGEDALLRARQEDKPILLSIGYSACHWCHVMAHESFENEAIAGLMNAHFINIKVDREERPDLDDIYMAATMAMNHGHGGWPMTVFLTPDQQPFFAGTYFPPEDRHGRPGFPAILRRIAELWRDNRPALERVGGELAAHLRESVEPSPGAIDLDAVLTRLTDQLASTFDPTWGGFGRAPKFPPATLLRLLLVVHRRGDPRALPMVRRTLDGMARGGMYDQIGGGFCRYSTDDQWLVPHFEKMLYDNALLARTYLEGYQVTEDAYYRQVATEVFEYVLREMTAPAGGFHSATDADSEGEEGRFFVWTPAEVRAVLGTGAAPLALAWFDISEDGNWEGRSIPRTPRSLTEVAGTFGLDVATARVRLVLARDALYAARGARVAPGLDDKVLTAWNGLMIGAMAEGARVLGETRWLDAAVRAAEFVLDNLRATEGRLLRSWRAGTAHLNAYLEDYAFLGNGLLDLYEAGGGARFLHEAGGLAERMLADFAAPGGGFFSTSAGHEPLLVRHREGHDGALPGANGAAAQLLARLAAHEGRADWRTAAEDALGAWGAALAREPRAFAQSLLALGFLREGPVELAFIGPAGDAGLAALRQEVARHFLPHRVIGHHDPADGATRQPLLTGKERQEGRSALYVCREFACRRPVTRPDEVPAALGVPGA